MTITRCLVCLIKHGVNYCSFPDPYRTASSRDAHVTLYIFIIISGRSLLNSDGIQPGQCWTFQGHEGSTIITLIRVILVTFITLDHIHPTLSLRQTYSDAPKEFDIHVSLKGFKEVLWNLHSQLSYFFYIDNNEFWWNHFQALVNEEDLNGTLLGTFFFENLWQSTSQQFAIKVVFESIARLMLNYSGTSPYSDRTVHREIEPRGKWNVRVQIAHSRHS